MQNHLLSADTEKELASPATEQVLPKPEPTPADESQKSTVNIADEYEFELSDEVREKIESAEDRHVLISTEDLSDLTYLPAPGKGCRFIKRAMDIVLSFCGLLVLTLPLILVALAVFIDDPGKVLFRQYRVGRNGKRFRLYKFRTMKKETPKYLSTMEVERPDQYVTRLGRFLRKFSLDELPQLFNVFRGDMSLVGPRPLISDEYEIHQMRMTLGVYNIRPGVTGLAQINGRDTVSPQDKVRWDYEYLKNCGLKTDLKILLATVPKVFGHAGVVEGYSITRESKSADAQGDNLEAKDQANV